MTDLGSIEALVERWQLAPPERVRGGTVGERPAARLGSGLEFHDRREYAAGDDPRRLDWRALARSDHVLVRLAREESSPRLELLVDLSASMGVEEEKAALARALVVLFAALARRAGWPFAAIGLRAVPERIAPELLTAPDALARDDLLRALEWRPGPPVGEALLAARGMLAPGGCRIVVSDFVGGDLAPALGHLARGATALALVQVLGPEEAHPFPGGLVRMVDAESGAEIEVELDARAVDVYRARLDALAAVLADAARRTGGRFVPLVGGPPLARVCEERLFPAGLLEPA